MPYVLGAASKLALKGVHPDLVRVVELAITYSKQDFTVFCGTRTLAQQEALVRDRRSKTLKSLHLVQPDGYGHAVDLVAYVGDGHLEWTWDRLYSIAEAMRKAARELNVPITWGCAWNIDLRKTTALPKDVAAAYANNHGPHPFMDGPHFELRLEDDAWVKNP